MTPLRQTTASGGKPTHYSFLLAAVLSFGFAPLRAELLVGEGATGAEFLKIPIAARANAMGGAFTAASGDAASLEYNPAGLTGIMRADINATFIKYLEDTSLQSISVGYPFQFGQKNQSGNKFLGPDSDIVVLGLHYRLFQGDDEARNEVGVRLDEFDIRDQLIQLSVGYAPFSNLSVGLSGKIINEKIQNESVSNFAGDAGILWKPVERWSLGASLLNMGPAKAFITEKDPLPTTLRVGVGYETKNLLLLSDVSAGRDKTLYKALGAEWKTLQILRLRAGVVNHTTTELTGGIGVYFTPPSMSATPQEREKKDNRQTLEDWDIPEENPVFKENTSNSKSPLDFGIDYSFRTNNDLGGSHNITLRVLY